VGQGGRGGWGGRGGEGGMGGTRGGGVDGGDGGNGVDWGDAGDGGRGGVCKGGKRVCVSGSGQHRSAFNYYMPCRVTGGPCHGVDRFSAPK
jgi:hypothetical protein